MKKNILSLTFLAALSYFMYSCHDEVLPKTIETAQKIQLRLPEAPYNYEDIALPTNNLQFGSGGVDNTLFENSRVRGLQVTNAGATLGRVLFYDKNLSLNNAVACASCHNQTHAFAEPFSVSTGFEGRKTPRNSMAITNVGMSNTLFWDTRESNLKSMVLRPVQNHIEMGMEDLDALPAKLAKLDYYPSLFAQAFPNQPSISKENIAEGLRQFLSAMVTANSKFDQAKSTDFSTFTDLERLGHTLFFSDQTNCFKCHSGANFTESENLSGEYGSSAPAAKIGTANVGLDVVYKDNGRNQGQFKIPSLRNVGLTAPYMHDGRFKSLEEVVEHYNSGIKMHPNLDKNLKNNNGTPRRMNLSGVEKAALVAFLHTLTDMQFTKEVKYANPFE